MSSGHDVSEYELVASGLPRLGFRVYHVLMFHHNNRKKILVWCDDPSEDPVISIFAGCLANHDRAHSLRSQDQRRILQVITYSFPSNYW
jgi:hypothetical protein